MPSLRSDDALSINHIFNLDLCELQTHNEMKKKKSFRAALMNSCAAAGVVLFSSEQNAVKMH
jgi:hypothetical protein